MFKKLKTWLSDKEKSTLYIAKVSVLSCIAVALFQFCLSIYMKSIFLAANGLYNIGLAWARVLAINTHNVCNSNSQLTTETKQHMQVKTYKQVGIIIAISSFLYMVYSISMFLGIGQTSSLYTTIIGITIAAITFYSIGVAIYGIVSMKKAKQAMLVSIKITNLVVGIISLTLTQTALLAMTHTPNSNVPNGIIGTITGFACLCIGIYMIFNKKIVFDNN